MLDVALPEDLESVEDECFVRANIVQISIPKNTKCIGNKAFCGCANLEKVVFADGSQL